MLAARRRRAPCSPLARVALQYEDWSNTLVMDTRAGVSYYHNIADTLAKGLRSSEEVGITGANLDEYPSGLTSIDLDGYDDPMLGFGGSLPWDRSERTIQIASTLTKLWGNHSVKFGGDYRYNRDFLLQTQDNGGRAASTGFKAPARRFAPIRRPSTAWPTRSPPSCWINRTASVATTASLTR